MKPESLADVPSQTGTGLEFEFVTAQEYPKRFLEDVKNAHSKLVLQSMGLVYDDETAPVLEEVLKQNDSLTDSPALVLPDSYSKLYVNRAALWSPRSSDRRIVREHNRLMADYQARLQVRGALTRHIHPYMGRGRVGNIMPLAGRNHTKFGIADDVVYSLGGVNFSEASFEAHDYMLRAESPILAEALHIYANAHITSGRVEAREDLSFHLEDGSKVLIDIGKRKQSVIYDMVCNLAKVSDKEILFVSQFSPEGRLEKLLHEKQNELGTENVQVILNNAREFGFPVSIEQRGIQRSTPLDYQEIKEGYVHAKFMIFTNSDGQKTVVSGSHNFNEKGVRFGTAEIALVSTNLSLIAEFEEFANRLPI